MYTEETKQRVRKDLVAQFQTTEVITAMPTPMTHSGAVDYDAVELLTRHLQKNAVDGILIGGSTGEEPTLKPKEKWAVFERVKKTLRRRDGTRNVKLIAGTGCSSTWETIAETKHAIRAGADVALVIVPPQVKPNDDGQRFHFGAVAKAAPNLPIIIYNIPSRTGVNMKPEIVAELAQRHPNIIGIKQSYGDLEQVAQLKRLCPKDFLIYSGDDDLTLEMLRKGAHGVISVASNIDNASIKRMVVAEKAGKPQEADQINRILTPLYKACFVTTNPIPVKHLLTERVAPWMTSTLRPPLVPMNLADHQKMHALYIQYRSNMMNPEILQRLKDLQAE